MTSPTTNFISLSTNGSKDSTVLGTNWPISDWENNIEMFYLNSTLNFGILPLLVFQLVVYYKVDSLLTGLTAQQIGTTACRYSNKTPQLSKAHCS